MGIANNAMQGVAWSVFSLVIISLMLKVAGEVPLSSEFSAVRPLLETENVSNPMIEEHNTIRVDPLAKFNKYRGGYNITEKHYWSSVLFTGAYGYVIGVIWLLLGVIYGGFVVINCICCKTEEKGKLKKSSPSRRDCGIWPLLLAVFLTVLAMTASGLALVGNAGYHSRAGNAVNIIIETANEASETINKTTGDMKEIASNIGGPHVSQKSSEFLKSTSSKLDAEASEIQREARKNRYLIHKGLKIVYVTTTVAIILNLVTAISMSISGVLRFRRTLKLFMMACWVMTTICWLFSGTYFFLEKFSADTCTALDGFQQNPYNNSLSAIIPCDELLSVKPVLSEFGEGIYNLVNEVNANISVLQATITPNLALVCNPFSPPPNYQYQPEDCPANTIRIGEIPEVLKLFTCSDPDNRDCNDGQFISYSNYKMVEAYVSSIQTILDAYPRMEGLIDCQSVKDAFAEILRKHCRPLRRFARMVWLALLVLGVSMIMLVLIWTKKAQQFHFLSGSVEPNPAKIDVLQLGASKVPNQPVIGN